MTIRREDVLRIAELAELEVPPDEVDPLAQKLGRVLEYVAQLREVDPAAGEAPSLGSASAPFRTDEVRPVPLLRSPQSFAPEFRDGFFLVPRRAGMEDG